eukprot:6987412-Prymnesium_polylepis.1
MASTLATVMVAWLTATPKSKQPHRHISSKDHVGMCGMCKPVRDLKLKRMPPANMSSIKCWPAANASGLGGRAPLTIFSMASNLPHEYVRCLTHRNRLVYARRFGYEYCHAFARPTAVVMNNAWHKLVALQGLLREVPRRPAVFFMDADALLMNMNVPATSFLARYPSKLLLFGTEYNDCDRQSRVVWRLPRPFAGMNACDSGYPGCPPFRRINGGTFI